MVNATFNVDETRLDFRIDKALQASKSLKFLFLNLEKETRKENIKNFRLKGTGQYQPLSARYAEQKRRLAGRNLPILVGASKDGGESGKLREATTKRNNRNAISDIKPLSARFGVKGGNSGLPYAAAIQYGSRRNNLPARPYFVVSDKRIENFEKTTGAYLTDSWGK